jgi:4-hydroxy-3-methylbut-2-enyl diphosphate reductase
MRVAARAVAGGAPTALVARTGMGADRATRSAAALVSSASGTAPQPPQSSRTAKGFRGGSSAVSAVAVTGVCSALSPDLEPGDLVVATEVRGPSGVVALPSAPLLAAALRRAGLRVHAGPVVSVGTLVRGRRRAELAASGALAVDMSSASLVSASWLQPVAVVRAVIDTPDRELPSATVTGGRAAWRALRQAAPVLETWAAAAGTRRVLLAGPRSFCAGVDRAIETVERALDRFGSPVYVRKQIVHNLHVVRRLEDRGAVFVEELDEVPDDATVVFSAHGVSPAVRQKADARGLSVIDATCPLVAKVHTEVRRFAGHGYQVVLIGHRGHDEIEGTVGEAANVQVVEDVADVDRIDAADPDKVAYITQTTLAVDETTGIVDALKERFPSLVGPHSDDICYASQNRQDAVRAIAKSCDLVLVVGSANSSNSVRLVEVARREGCQAELLDDESGLDLAWLPGAATIGVTAGASAPPELVDRVVDALRGLGPVEIAERPVTTETVTFNLPPEVR